jgi:hypothetical protein
MASAIAYINSVNTSASQLSHVQPMTVQDVYTLVTLMGLYLSEASCHQKAYKELLAHIDDSHVLTIDKVQHEIIKFSRSHTLDVFALTHTDDSQVCNHRCPRCCDTRGETSRPSRSSSSPCSHSSSNVCSPRHTFSATAFPVNTFCCDLGLDPDYHVFAAVLQSNRVSPHQVHLDPDIDSFCHPDAGHALARAAANYPEVVPSDDDSACFFGSLSCCWERTGIFLRRALNVEGCSFVSVFLSVFLSLRAGSISFRYQQWSGPFIWRS